MAGLTHIISIKGQRFEMDPSGAMYWHDKRALLIADVHLGKVAHFRKHGAAIPPDLARENYKKLNRVIRKFRPQQLIFLGDLFHSSMNTDWDHFVNWVLSKHLEVTLIFGNHDIISAHKFTELGFRLFEEYETNGMLLTHHPTESEEHFNLAGHIHPGVKLKGSGRQSMRLACFYKTTNRLILPAFGIFTGKHTLRPSASDEVFVIADGAVLHMPKPSIK